MTIKLAVIGAGIMGADHARIVAEDLPGATLQVVCDMDEARARKVAEAYGAADVATIPEAVIGREDVYAVIVASPDVTHAPLSLACIKAGKKVMCEKPLSASPDECLEVMKAEEVAGARDVMLGRIDIPDAAARAADVEARKAGEAAIEDDYGCIDYQGDYTQELIDETDYPSFDVKGACQAFYQWKKHKKADIMTFRNNAYKSVITGTQAPLHHTPCKDALDDSMAEYLKN